MKSVKIIIRIGLAALLLGLGWYAFKPKPRNGFDQAALYKIIDQLRDERSAQVFAKVLRANYKDYYELAQLSDTISKADKQFYSVGRKTYRLRTVQEYEQVIMTGLQDLDFVKPEKLPPCSQFKYYALRSKFENALTVVEGQPKNIESVEMVQRLRGDMQIWASRHRGAPKTYADLELWAEGEITTLNREYAKLRQDGDISDLDLYSQENRFFEKNSSHYTEQFKLDMEKARDASAGHFYDYNLDDIKVSVAGKCHRHKAYASYGYSGVITLYFCQEKLDRKRNMFLAAHEYYPGHHLQYGIKHLQKICWNRSRPRLSLGEGWASYGEYLEPDITYDAPEQKLGWLDYRHIRAMRVLMDIARYRDGALKPEQQTLWKARIDLYNGARSHIKCQVQDRVRDGRAV